MSVAKIWETRSGLSLSSLFFLLDTAAAAPALRVVCEKRGKCVVEEEEGGRRSNGTLMADIN